MGNMKYKVGDKVRIKSLDWYNENKDEDGDVNCHSYTFFSIMRQYCGKIHTINSINDFNKTYKMTEDDCNFNWTDEMIEGLVEEETKPKFKVGDKIISDVFSTKDDKGWEVIDVERTGYKLISVNNPDLICDMDFKNEHYYKLVEEKCDYVQVDNIPDVIQAKTASVCSHNGFYGYSDSEGNETSEWYLPDGHQFVDENGNVINATKIVLDKKKKEYPKTYEECSLVLEYIPYTDNVIGYKWDVLKSFQKLLICRDAYWKIAGEEMELGKDLPWVPDWMCIDPIYVILYQYHAIYKAEVNGGTSCILAFPTEEMRDAFYENFKELIESVKELL